MMPDIFSVFDPHMSSSLIPVKLLFLALMPAGIIPMFSHLFPTSSWMSSLLALPVNTMFTQYARTTAHSLKGLTHPMIMMFIMIIMVNLAGLLPYCFSLSSHLLMTLSLGLPLWLSLVVSSFTKAPKSTTAHFLPDGAPDWLNPFLVLIETTSVLVRPLTLSFRLAANMTAGHIVLSLVGVYAASSIFLSITSTTILITVESFYILFESAICLIQAYIFLLLISLYSDDHAS